MTDRPDRSDHWTGRLKAAWCRSAEVLAEPLRFLASNRGGRSSAARPGRVEAGRVEDGRIEEQKRFEEGATAVDRDSAGKPGDRGDGLAGRDGEKTNTRPPRGVY